LISPQSASNLISLKRLEPALEVDLERRSISSAAINARSDVEERRFSAA
jgi:hypothetical protein